MRKNCVLNFEGVRGPLNYLIEHTGLILTDLTKAKTLLARLDGLVQTQDAPAAELPPDTPERFISDMLDMLDHLYQAGLIKKNFPPDNREQTKANLVRTLHINPSIVRATLEQFVQQNTGAAEAKVMLDRLDGLAQSVPLKEYVYKMEANPRTVGAIDQQFIQAYERTAQGTLKPDRVLFFGTADKCAGILKKLQSGELKPDDFFQPGTATERYNGLSEKIKAAEQRMAEIAVLKTHIINYSKTRDVYVAYRKAGYSKKFKAEHESEILLHQAAKEAFDGLGLKKLPTVKSLQAEYAALLAEKKSAYSDYRRARDEMKELLTVKANVDRLMGYDKSETDMEVERQEER